MSAICDGDLGFKVGTAGGWHKYQDGTVDMLIKGGTDILLCNACSLAEADAGEFFGQLLW